MHMVKAPVVSGQGEPIGLICISRDITNCKLAEAELAQYQVELKNRIAEQTRELEEKVFNLVESHEKQKQTEVELRESEERFRQIAENINSFFWIRDLPAGQILYVSPAYEKIWGRPCESLYKNPESWLEAVHPEDREWVLARHFPRKTPEQGLEFRIIGKGGIICWIRSKVFMVCDQSGRNYREVGVAEDITTYMEILARWQESESRYRTFFETSTDGVSICTGKKLVDCNASFMRLSGYDKVELLDLADISTIMNFINKQTGDERRSPSLDIIRENGRCGGLYSWLRPDGRTNFIECRGNRLIVNGTDLMHCVHRDMTQVKLAEEKIRHLSRRIIESTEEEQKRIARDLHDEFGQRLLSMRHKVDALQKKLVFAGKPELLELTEIGELIETIGSVVRGVTTRLRPDMLDTLGFLSTLQWGMQDFAERYPMIRTSMEIVGAEKEILPEYETALYRVFQEGLVNIAKHAEACTVTARLIFSYPSCFLTLADDGRGFELDPLSGAALKNNAGLGLRSMQERMLAIGGTFVIRSRPGEGTLLRAEVCQPVPPPEALPLFMMPGRKRS
jgi:PAS domain S-box-containing protein